MLSIRNLIRDPINIRPEFLNTWQWIFNKKMEIIMISNFGDPFLKDEQGLIFFLITDGGELTQIATSYSEFELLLLNEENVDQWFLPTLIEKLTNAGMILNKDQVFSPLKLAVLGGKYEVPNFKPIDLKTHFEFTGIICEQIKDLSDGTDVNIKVVD